MSIAQGNTPSELVQTTQDLEQWKIDQNAGRFWYVGESYLYTHDPEEDNPGTLVIIPGPESTEIRIFPDLSLTKNGETRVRYAFGKSLEDADNAFELWPTVLVEARQGYINVPEDFVDRFLNEAQRRGAVVLEIIDRFDEPAVRTFIFDGYREAYEEIRATQPSLAIASTSGKYIVTFNVHPGDALVDVYGQGFFGTSYKTGQGSGPSFTVELPPNRYRYVSKLRGYVEQERRFTVPDTVEVTIEMEPPSGRLKTRVENGFMSSKLYGVDWPLTVDEVSLECKQPEKAIASVRFDKKYALNRAAEDDYPSIEPLVEEFRNDNRDIEKMAVTPLIEMALERCE